MNTYAMNINEEILENVSGGRPVGRDGKPISAAEYKNRKNEIHVTSGTFTFLPEYRCTDVDGIHVTSGTFTFGTEFTETYVDGIHTTSATF